MAEPTMMPARVAGVMGLDGVVRWSWFSGSKTGGVGVGEEVEMTVDVAKGSVVDVDAAATCNEDGGDDVGVLVTEGEVVEVMVPAVDVVDAIETSKVELSVGVSTCGGGCGATGAGSLPVLPD